MRDFLFLLRSRFSSNTRLLLCVGEMGREKRPSEYNCMKWVLIIMTSVYRHFYSYPVLSSTSFLKKKHTVDDSVCIIGIVPQFAISSSSFLMHQPYT